MNLGALLQQLMGAFWPFPQSDWWLGYRFKHLFKMAYKLLTFWYLDINVTWINETNTGHKSVFVLFYLRFKKKSGTVNDNKTKYFTV